MTNRVVKGLIHIICPVFIVAVLLFSGLFSPDSALLGLIYLIALGAIGFGLSELYDEVVDKLFTKALTE